MKRARGALFFGSVVAPSVGDAILQWGMLVLSLCPGESRGKRPRRSRLCLVIEGVGVRDVAVLELRRIFLIECLYTLILKIKTEGWFSNCPVGYG